MKWHTRMSGILLVLLLVTLGCNAIRGRGAGGEVHIEVHNQSVEEICYVYISSSESDSWGDNQLPPDKVISPNKSKTFAVEQGTYDVDVENCDEVVVATAWEIASDRTVAVGAPEATAHLLVHNTSGVELCFVYIASSDQDEWGDDWLGEMESLPPDARRIFFVKPGLYDFMVVDCDGQSVVEEYAVNLSNDVYWPVE